MEEAAAEELAEEALLEAVEQELMEEAHRRMPQSRPQWPAFSRLQPFLVPS
jgi:hypothetical protein